MLVLFTDFGFQGPYVGLLKRVLLEYAPGEPIIDLFHDAPAFDVQGSAYLLAAYTQEFPQGSVFVGVIDPGVGSKRPGMILNADGYWFVGPDNGLFDRVGSRAREVKAWHISWRPQRLSASFHGRDLFAPVAALLATETARPQDLGKVIPFPLRHWPDDLARVIYIDRYGNSMTGIRASSIGRDVTVRVREHRLVWARTFSEVPPGQGFWYENSSGLVELAVNQGSAAHRFGLSIGDVCAAIGTTYTSIKSC